MNKTAYPIILFCLSTVIVNAQKEVRNFIFGHSLINHEFQLNITPSQETSVPHWLASLARAADHQYVISGQYGFLPQHANLPPIAQWGFDSVDGAWDSDNEDFSAADFNTIMITPGNFIQWQSPNEDYPTDPISPVEATNTIFEWCNSKESNLDFFIYENWPDMAPYLSNGFPPSAEEWSEYNIILNNNFHNWFIDYYSQVAKEFSNNCVSFIPAGTLISNLLQTAPYDEIPISELYEDDAPHGRATIYFLSSLVTYMSIYEEAAPAGYLVDEIIHPLIRENYSDVVNLFWAELNNLNESSDFTIFCKEPISSSNSSSLLDYKVNISPNPTTSRVTISGETPNHIVLIYDILGRKVKPSYELNHQTLELDFSDLDNGTYVIIGIDQEGRLLYRKRIIKI